MNNADMPATPIQFEWETNSGDKHIELWRGLTKRETFAMHAMQGILSNQTYEPPRRGKIRGMAIDAVNAADVLLAALDE